MCLVFLAFRVNPERSVLVGANREESRRRPSTPPVPMASGSLRCWLAGEDRGPDGQAARVGTWLGVNETGLIVAVTNRRDGELAPEDQIRSRGWLAVDLLGFEDPAEGVRFATADLGRGGYGGGNFLIANRVSAFVVEAPGAHRVRVRQLDPGIHALTNLDPNDLDDPRIRLVHERLEPDRFVASAIELCRDEHIVISDAERGTVSSSLVLVGDTIRFDHVEGDPRRGEFESCEPFPR